MQWDVCFNLAVWCALCSRHITCSVQPRRSYLLELTVLYFCTQSQWRWLCLFWLLLRCATLSTGFDFITCCFSILYILRPSEWHASRLKAGVVCLRVKLCDPHLSALEVRFSWQCAIQIYVCLYLTLLCTCCKTLYFSLHLNFAFLKRRKFVAF